MSSDSDKGEKKKWRAQNKNDKVRKTREVGEVQNGDKTAGRREK